MVTHSRARTIVAVVVILAAGAFAYSTGLSGPLIYDDTAIWGNPTIRSLWPLWKTLRAPPGSTFASRPLVNLSFAINYAITGNDVRGYHVTNIAIHLLAALVLFGLLRGVFRLPRLVDRWGSSAEAIALGTTLLWEVHPLLSEVVTYTSTRTEGLMGLFFLVAFYCFVRGFESLHASRWRAACVGACVLGMGCKEVMATAPILIYLFDALLVCGTFAGPWRQRERFYAALVLTLPIVPILVWTQADFAAKTGQGFQLMTPWTYALTQCGMIVHYLRLAVWPNGLVVDYWDWPIAQSVRDVWAQAAVIVGLLLVTAWALLGRRPWAFLGAWFFVILAPTSSFIPLRLEIGAERRMYLPLIAVVMLVVLGAVRLATAVKTRLVRDGLVFILAGTVAVLALATRWRNVDYSTAVLIWSDTVAKRPNNARAEGMLAEVLLAAGRLRDARAAYERAVQLKPWDGNYQNMLGNLLAGEGKTDDAISHLERAVMLASKEPAFHTSLGYALARKGETEAAMRQFRSALRLDPKQVDALVYIADILAARGDTAEALLHLHTAMRLAPDDAEIRAKYERLKGMQK